MTKNNRLASACDTVVRAPSAATVAARPTVATISNAAVADIPRPTVSPVQSEDVAASRERRARPGQPSKATDACDVARDVVVVGEFGITARAAIHDGPAGADHLRALIADLAPPAGPGRGEYHEAAILDRLSSGLAGEGDGTGLTLLRHLAAEGFRVGAVGTVSTAASPGHRDLAAQSLDRAGVDRRLVQIGPRLDGLTVLICDGDHPSVLTFAPWAHPLIALLRERWREVVNYLAGARLVVLDLPACSAVAEAYLMLVGAVRERNPAVRIAVHSFCFPGSVQQLVPLLAHADLVFLHDGDAQDLVHDDPTALAHILASGRHRAIVQLDCRHVDVIRPIGTPGLQPWVWRSPTSERTRPGAARKVPGLFVIGEAVDVTGWLGGYNFQWAWSSGWAAGEAV